MVDLIEGCVEAKQEVLRAAESLYHQDVEHALEELARATAILNELVEKPWVPEDDCQGMAVPEMVIHIFKHRKSMARAPNGHTCPFLTVEEWSKIHDWAHKHQAKTRQPPPDGGG